VLPNSDHSPTKTFEGLIVASVSADVSTDLLLPINLIALRHSQVAVASMPEATINENREALFPKHKVRFAVQSLVSPPSLNAVCPEYGDEFQLRVFVPTTTDTGHAPRAFCFGENVSHSKPEIMGAV